MDARRLEMCTFGGPRTMLFVSLVHHESFLLFGFGVAQEFIPRWRLQHINHGVPHKERRNSF